MASQQEIVDSVTKKLKGIDLSKKAISILKEATESVLIRIKQDVDAQIKEDSSPIVETFVTNAAKKMSAMTQQWADGVKNELVVFPEGTRYIWRDGPTTTIVVEQQPQVRHVNVYGKVYLLSMPYIQFILSFRNHRSTQELHVTCTKKPMSDLDQAANFLPLSNIGSSHQVCMGSFKWPAVNNMTDFVNQIIGEFWQSAFNYDNGGGLLKFFADNNLQPLTTQRESVVVGYKKWAEKTKENPLYATEQTTKYTPGTTFRSFLLSDDSGENGSQTIVKQLKQEIHSSISTIGGDIQKLLKNTDLLTENRDKTHAETLEGVIKQIIVQAYAELHEYSEEELEKERIKLRKEMQESAAKLKKDFIKYMDEKKKVW